MDRDASSVERPSLVVMSATATRWQLARVVWGLAWPVILTFSLESLVGLVDMLMVGRLGAAAVAGVGVGTQILGAVDVVIIAISTGTLALVARHVGAVERRRAQEVLLQSLYVVTAISILTAGTAAVFARELVQFFGVEPAVLEQGTVFTRRLMLGVPAAGVFIVTASALRGAGDTRTPLLIGLLMNVVNVVGNYILIFGKLGFPALGVRGSAFASVIALSIGALASIGVLVHRRSVLTLYGLSLRPRLAEARRILSIGFPTALEQLLMQVGFMLFLAIAARYGTAAVAAYFIGVRILALSFLPGFGFAAAASTLVGQNLGARRPEAAERSGWEANRLAMVLMSLAGAVIFITAGPIAQAFIDDPAVIEDAVTFIRVLAACQPLMAADFTLGGALRGAGDTTFPLVTVIIAFYGARLGFAYAAAAVFSLSLPWVWSALFGDYIVRALLKAWRFQSGRWKTIKI
jgi:putative MATE family efflux protein